MRWLILTVAGLLALEPVPTSAQQSSDLQAAHIAAHVPASEDFDAILERDLAAYLGDRASGHLEFELLRDGPTQSGVSYPKFYLWVRSTSVGGRHTSGAARVAAIDRVRFEVTDFLDVESIVGDPDRVASTFPALLVDAIRRRATLNE